MKKLPTAPVRALMIGLLLLIGFTGCKEQPPAEVEVATVGQPAPDFILADLDGTMWRLSDLRGKVVFLNFWATWCPPCREEMPDMAALHREMALTGLPFQMLAVLTNDDPGQAARFAQKLGITFPIVVDREGKAAADSASPASPRRSSSTPGASCGEIHRRPPLEFGGVQRDAAGVICPGRIDLARER